MTAITIRQSTVADLERVANHYGSGDTPWDPFGDVNTLQTIPLEGLIIGEVDSRYAGFLYWFTGENPWFDPGVQRFAYITDVHVLEKYRGQGVGKKLLLFALDHLKGKEIVYITAAESNVVARHIYENAGFRGFSRSIHYKLER